MTVGGRRYPQRGKSVETGQKQYLYIPTAILVPGFYVQPRGSLGKHTLGFGNLSKCPLMHYDSRFKGHFGILQTVFWEFSLVFPKARRVAKI